MPEAESNETSYSVKRGRKSDLKQVAIHFARMESECGLCYLPGAGILPSGVQCRTADCHERLGPGVDGLQECGGWGGGERESVVQTWLWAACSVLAFWPEFGNPPWHQGPGAPHSKLSQCRAEMLTLLPSPPSSRHDAQL